MLRAAIAVGLLGLLSSSAVAEPSQGVPTEAPAKFTPRRILTVPNPHFVPDEKLALAPAAALGGHTIYLNRCVGGCMLVPGNDDMTISPIVSSIPNNPTTIEEATDLTEAEWDGVVQCVKEVYSPYDVKIVEQEPGPEVPVYSGIIVGGNNSAKAGAALGLDPNIGGVVSGVGCSANPRAVAYAFADSNNVDTFAFEVGGNNDSINRIRGLCWIIAQETAHAVGLDHSFAYTDGNQSACNDPMTYRFECGGQKFFRNRFAKCGEFAEQGERPCQCGANQNTHLRLVNIFGAGTSLIPPPSVALLQPSAPSSAANSLTSTVTASAGSARGVGRVELHINGFKWAEVPGALFGRNGQPNPSSYQLIIPAALPDSIVDVVIKAFDDLELVNETAPITLVKGAAGGCQSADTCAEGQKCEAGKCFWDPPAGVLGDDCSFPQACVSGLCSDTVFEGEGICTQSCILGLEGACPEGLECVAAGADAICFTPQDDGGCCSTSNDSAPWAPFLLGGVVIGFVVFRRRRA
ncbi:MAG: hypothetical protein H0V17_05145 [Deltaproteobacteria bacterium]|nr:hypothetical protein [Deltaproteobacteria bacterium]